MARVSIEDCLDYMDNRFALVTIAAERTRALMGGAEPMVKSRNKEAVTALREIAEGFVIQHRETPGAGDAAKLPNGEWKA